MTPHSADDVDVRRVDYQDIGALHDRRRLAADWQIVRDSILPRGLANPYLILHHDSPIGYAGVWNEHWPGRVMDFYVDPAHQALAPHAFTQLVTVSGATHVEAQTNDPLPHEMLSRFTEETMVENLLFEEGRPVSLDGLGLSVRERAVGDEGPDGQWVVESDGKVLAGGGYLTHYNRPFVDLFLEVVPAERCRGIGRYFVQELRRICVEQELRPAARCDPDNVASQKALERGGLERCGAVEAGRIHLREGGI